MRPTRRLIWLLAPLLACAVADLLYRVLNGGAAGSTFAAWQYGVAVLLTVSLLDVLMSRSSAKLHVTRITANSCSLGRWQPVRLEITVSGAGARAQNVEIFDLVPDGMAFRDLPVWLKLVPGELTTLQYHVLTQRRGDFVFPGVHVRRRSRMGLWEIHHHIAAPTTVRVYPDFSWLNRYLLLVDEKRMARAGVMLAPRRGDGLEFHQLREYRRGDSQRQIDWKATARRASLISREYQEERDQQILFVLDTGRRMRARDGVAGSEVAHFDEVLRAMLLLGFVALRQGDAVGLLTFGRERRWLPMQRGTTTINRLLHTVYDLDADTSASDYIAAAQEIRLRQKHRALVVLLTNAREEDEDLITALELLGRRHIVLVTSLRERAVDSIEQAPVNSLDDALMSAAASSHQIDRGRIRESVMRAGHRLLDSSPAQLPLRLVNDYWQLKRSGKL